MSAPQQTLPGAPKAVMYVYPWDLYDHGVDDSLASLRDCGIDAVQLAFSYHVATFLHPRNPRRRINFGEQGALHFDPSVLPESAWPFVPPVSAEVSGPRYLTDLLEAVASHGLQSIAWVVYLYNHTLARARPDLAVHNAFGDPNGAQLCPANPEVRDYARALTRAVALHEPLAGFVCESLSYLAYDYGFLNPKTAVVPGARARLLLGLCFCEHCRAEAREDGIPVEELEREVREAFDDHLAQLPDRAPIEDDGPDWSREAFGGKLQAYLQMRERVAVSLQRAVLEMASEAGLRTGSSSAEGQDERVTGVRVQEIRSHLDELRIELFPGMEPAAMRKLIEDARERADGDVPTYALAQLSHFASEGDFVEAFENARELGIEHFRIYQFGLLTKRQMGWLRRASPFWSNGELDSATR